MNEKITAVASRIQQYSEEFSKGNRQVSTEYLDEQLDDIIEKTDNLILNWYNEESKYNEEKQLIRQYMDFCNDCVLLSKEGMVPVQMVKAAMALKNIELFEVCFDDKQREIMDIAGELVDNAFGNDAIFILADLL